MMAMDRQVERYGADAPLTDPQRCSNEATHGITTGDYTRNLCPDHVAPTLHVTGGNVRVYPLQAKQRCEYPISRRWLAFGPVFLLGDL